MKKNKNNSITTSYKGEVSFTEIDFTLRDEILGKEWEDKEDRGALYLGRDSHTWQMHVNPVNIDKVINTLQKMKADGANYVEIMYHEDHVGYYFNGAHIYQSTDEEIKIEEERIQTLKKKQKAEEIKELESKLAKLKK